MAGSVILLEIVEKRRGEGGQVSEEKKKTS
jgi:hypothetical protein